MGKKKRTIFKRNRMRENDEHSGRVYYEDAFDVRSKRYEFSSHELINAFLRIFFYPTTMEFPSTHQQWMCVNIVHVCTETRITRLV